MHLRHVHHLPPCAAAPPSLLRLEPAHCRIYDLRTKSSASVICECATPDAIAAAWDSHDNLLVSQLKNTFTHIEPRRKRTHKPAVIREGDEVRSQQQVQQWVQQWMQGQLATSFQHTQWQQLPHCAVCSWQDSTMCPVQMVINWCTATQQVLLCGAGNAVRRRCCSFELQAPSCGSVALMCCNNSPPSVQDGSVTVQLTSVAFTQSTGD